MSDLKAPPQLPPRPTTPSAPGTPPTPGTPTSAARHRLPPAPDMSTPPPTLPTRPRIIAPPAAVDAPDPLARVDPGVRAPPEADSFIRDPHKLIAYIVPFPTPALTADVPPAPIRFLIYTPPPPPLMRPSEGEKEGTTGKIQRKWQEEVRAAHTSNHKVLSWHGIKAKVTRGVDWGVSHVTSADLDFLTRVPTDGDKHIGGRKDSGASVPSLAASTPPATTPAPQPVIAPTPTLPAETAYTSKAAEAAAEASSARAGEELPAYTEVPQAPAPVVFPPHHEAPSLPARRSSDAKAAAPDAVIPSSETPLAAETAALRLDDDHPQVDAAPERATVKLEEMVLIYPPDMGLTEDQIRTEFVNSILRTKSKAQRDAVIATGLLPVTAALDWALMFVGWVFGGALEVDAVWAAASYKGAKTARSVTKRLASSGEDSLKLVVQPSERAAVLTEFLHDKCVAEDHDRFRSHPRVPSAHTVLEAIGWESSGKWENQNWEDEKWERSQVEKDLSTTMVKAAGGWAKWCDKYEKNPKKAIKK